MGDCCCEVTSVDAINAQLRPALTEILHTTFFRHFHVHTRLAGTTLRNLRAPLTRSVNVPFPASASRSTCTRAARSGRSTSSASSATAPSPSARRYRERTRKEAGCAVHVPARAPTRPLFGLALGPHASASRTRAPAHPRWSLWPRAPAHPLTRFGPFGVTHPLTGFGPFGGMHQPTLLLHYRRSSRCRGARRPSR